MWDFAVSASAVEVLNASYKITKQLKFYYVQPRVATLFYIISTILSAPDWLVVDH